MVYFLPPTVLVILDGFGYRQDRTSNAIALAQTPNLDYLLKTYPHVLLQASGCAVGLNDGVMGNSEVGHFTIGSGRIVQQDAVIIDNAIKNGDFFANPILTKSFERLAARNGRLHIIGLLSDGGVHSQQSHAYAFLKAAQQAGIKDTFVHAILDGRDVAPQSASYYLQNLENEMQKNNYGILGSLHGRFYAMDRDKNWERTAASYRVLTEKQEMHFETWQHALDFYYNDELFDEFIPPTPLHADSIIADGDAVVFFNYRPDRARQLTQAFVGQAFDKFEHKKVITSFFMTPVAYDHDTLKTTVLYEKKPIKNTLMDVLEAAQKSMFAIAETEKYAHVTYFFNAGNEKVHTDETRVLIPSIVAKNYIHFPEMSADKITQAVIESLEHEPKDFYLINYANADMVGHSGNLAATIKAVECLDKQLGVLYETVVKKMKGTLYITADHGKAEEMFDEKTKQIKTSHTTNPVIFLMVQQGLENALLPCSNMQGLSDIAPCILKNMKLPIPSEMQKK